MNEQSSISLNLPFCVGEWLVDPAALRLANGDQEVKIEPKVMEVLLFLAQNAGQVVSRQDIESAVWEGVIVGYDSLGSTIIKLRKAFNDDSRNPSIIETVPKKGYRLIPPVKQIDSSIQQKVVSDAAEPDQSNKTNPMLAGLIAVLVFAGAIVLFFVENRPEPENEIVAEKIPVLAVLPFKNLSNDPQQEYFSDGVASDLITDLSNIHDVSVIARNTTFVYKNIDVDVRQLHSDLNVDYVIEGSVRKVDNAVRVSARLINAANGINVWADRFDAAYDDVFALQDAITNKIVSLLEIKLSEAEKNRIAQIYTNNIEAYDNFLHGYQEFWKFSRDANQRARSYYLKAIEIDQNFARAYANLAMTHSLDYVNGWSDNPKQSLDLASKNANKALAIDDSLPQVQWAVGLVNTYGKKFDDALAAAEKAITQSPNYADGYGLLATILNYTGRPTEARKVMLKAMTLNPRHTFSYKVIFGEIHFNLHQYEDAAKYLNQALEANPAAQEARLWLAATYSYLNKPDEASWELEQIRNAGVELTAEYIDKYIPMVDPAAKNHLVQGLIKAGLAL